RAGFVGDVQFLITTQKFGTLGTVSPATLTIPAHSGRDVAVHTTIPTDVGDVSAAVQVTRVGPGGPMSVPLTVRTLVPTSHQVNLFGGTITGGNGRDAVFGVGQSNGFYIDVPPGKRDMSISLRIPTDPNDFLFGILTSPEGQVASFQSNVTFDLAGNPVINDGYQLYVRDPRPGRWVFSLDVADTVTGLEVGQRFHARVSFDTVRVTASLPHGASTVLAAGVPVDVPVKITNTGQVPLTYFA